MPYTPEFLSNSLGNKIGTIPDATPTNDGVMTKAQAAKVEQLQPDPELSGNVVGPASANKVVQVDDVPVELVGHQAGQTLIFDPTNSKIIPSNNPAGSVMSVSASLPLSSSGGPNPNISLVGPLPVANGGTGSATGNASSLTDLPAAQLVGSAPQAVLATALGTGGIPIAATVLTATTRVETPTVGTTAGDQHALPVGTAVLLAADSALPAANLTGDVAQARIATALGAGGIPVAATVLTATTRVETPTVGTTAGDQHGLPSGTAVLLAEDSALPAGNLTGDVAQARIATALGAGGIPIQATVLTTSTRVETPTIGTTSGSQHALPGGTAILLAADSALPAANLTGDVAQARIATALGAGGIPIQATVLTATTRVETPTVGTTAGDQHSLPSGTAILLAADSALPAANLTGDVAQARIATALGAGGIPIAATVVTATTRVETPTVGTTAVDQHSLPGGTAVLLSADSALPAGNLTGDVAQARIATALGAGGIPIQATVLTASTRVETPTVGTTSGSQHALPSGTAILLAADSALPAANLTGDVAQARIATALGAGGIPIAATVVTATTRVETPTVGTTAGDQHALPVGTAVLLAADSALPAANLTGDVAQARISTALAAGGTPIAGTVLAASTRVETPTIGISSAAQHALPSGTGDVLTADSTIAITNKSISGATNTLTSIGNGSLTNSSITINGSAVSLGGSVAITAGLSSFYGDGSDGPATFDGTNTFPWASKSGSVYTLTRDVDLTTSTFNSGSTLVTAGFQGRSSVQVVNNGAMRNDGVDASGSSLGAAAAGGSLGAGTAGTNGVLNNSASNPVNVIDSLGGRGGNGGNAGLNTGGVAPVIGAPAASRGSIRRVPQSLIGAFLGNGGITPVRAGGGGGGGASSAVTATGGGGGGGGGVLTWAAPLWTGTGTVSCNGGNGANGTSTVGSAGGGGGGGGGVCLVTCPNYQGSNQPTATGGNFGTGAGGGNNGTAGSSGIALVLT